MKTSTVLFRAVNMLRGPRARAISPHTSVNGLVSLFQRNPRLRNEIITNVAIAYKEARLTAWQLSNFPVEMIAHPLFPWQGAAEHLLSLPVSEKVVGQHEEERTYDGGPPDIFYGSDCTPGWSNGSDGGTITVREMVNTIAKFYDEKQRPLINYILAAHDPDRQNILDLIKEKNPLLFSFISNP